MSAPYTQVEELTETNCPAGKKEAEVQVLQKLIGYGIRQRYFDEDDVAHARLGKAEKVVLITKTHNDYVKQPHLEVIWEDGPIRFAPLANVASRCLHVADFSPVLASTPRETHWTLAVADAPSYIELAELLESWSPPTIYDPEKNVIQPNVLNLWHREACKRVLNGTTDVFFREWDRLHASEGGAGGGSSSDEGAAAVKTKREEGAPGPADPSPPSPAREGITTAAPSPAAPRSAVRTPSPTRDKLSLPMVRTPSTTRDKLSPPAASAPRTGLRGKKRPSPPLPRDPPPPAPSSPVADEETLRELVDSAGAQSLDDQDGPQGASWSGRGGRGGVKGGRRGGRSGGRSEDKADLIRMTQFHYSPSTGLVPLDDVDMDSPCHPDHGIHPITITMAIPLLVGAASSGSSVLMDNLSAEEKEAEDAECAVTCNRLWLMQNADRFPRHVLFKFTTMAPPEELAALKKLKVKFSFKLLRRRRARATSPPTPKQIAHLYAALEVESKGDGGGDPRLVSGKDASRQRQASKAGSIGGWPVGDWQRGKEGGEGGDDLPGSEEEDQAECQEERRSFWEEATALDQVGREGSDGEITAEEEEEEQAPATAERRSTRKKLKPSCFFSHPRPEQPP